MKAVLTCEKYYQFGRIEKEKSNLFVHRLVEKGFFNNCGFNVG